jgi:hypothetical protein
MDESQLLLDMRRTHFLLMMTSFAGKRVNKQRGMFGMADKPWFMNRAWIVVDSQVLVGKTTGVGGIATTRSTLSRSLTMIQSFCIGITSLPSFHRGMTTLLRCGFGEPVSSRYRIMEERGVG